ncbi:MAG: hypothetical protein DCC75_04750 [Proteobacteria bacterium]|nr:MAG: hypothetical protein DCC75_04750 [Pseudomonadota bacterium]
MNRNAATLKHYLLALCLLIIPGRSLADLPALKIGFITDLTGIGAFFGVQTQRGALLAQKELREQGERIEIIFEDSAGKPPEGVTAAIRLLESEKVDAVICDTTPICTAISPTVRAAAKPLIYHSPAVSIRESNPLSFRNFLDYTASCAAIAENWKLRAIKEVGSLMPHIEFGEKCLDGLKQHYPDHSSFRYNPGDDLRTAVTLFKSKGIEAVAHVGYEGDFRSFFKHCRSQSYRPLHGLMDLMLTEVLLHDAGPDLDGATISGFQLLKPDFAMRLDQSFPENRNDRLPVSALGYNAVQALFQTWGACAGKFTQDCLVSNLSRSPKNAQLGFKGFRTGTPEYPVVLKELRAGRLYPLF